MTEIKEFKLELSLGATVTVNRESWFKPTATSSIAWTSVPTENEVRAATKLIFETVVEPLVTEMTELISKQQINS